MSGSRRIMVMEYSWSCSRAPGHTAAVFRAHVSLHQSGGLFESESLYLSLSEVEIQRTSLEVLECGIPNMDYTPPPSDFGGTRTKRVVGGQETTPVSFHLTRLGMNEGVSVSLCVCVLFWCFGGGYNMCS